MAKGEIAWESSGEGLPLVLTHGFGDSQETWDELWPPLSNRYCVLRWDLLGHGRSPRPTTAEAYTRDLALADLDAMIERAGGEVVLVGHSLGGYLSLCRAITKPAGVLGLILLSTGPGYRDPVARAKWNRGVQRVSKRLDVPSEAVGLVEQHDDLVMANLKRIEIPILLACGQEDTQYHAGMGFLESRLSNARLHFVPGAGHHPHRTHTDRLDAVIGEFLEEFAPPK
jgi:pimeloyl-ACP methyl ester carboxylesterase